jgi:hypothetical protein
MGSRSFVLAVEKSWFLLVVCRSSCGGGVSIHRCGAAVEEAHVEGVERGVVVEMEVWAAKGRL